MLKILLPNDYVDKVLTLEVDDDAHYLKVYRLLASKEEALDFMVKSIKDHDITSTDLFEKLV